LKVAEPPVHALTHAISGKDAALLLPASVFEWRMKSRLDDLKAKNWHNVGQIVTSMFL
jgi:hypothetical protein